MIDTLALKLPAESLIIPPLSNVEIRQSEWGVSEIGFFKNLHVKNLNGYVTLSGSLQKFSGKDSLNFDQCKNAINDLCHTFSFNPREAQLNRIDFAKTIKTVYEPKIYYPHLGSHQSYFRSPYKNSLNYSNSIRTLTFYDKAKEQKIGSNLLRYEQRYLKPVTVFRHKLYLIDLLTVEVYDYFLKNWHLDYRNINKIKTLVPMENINTPKDLFNYLIILGASQIGSDALSSQIKIAQKTGKLNKQNAKRIRDRIKQLAGTNLYESNSLIDELDSKFSINP